MPPKPRGFTLIELLVVVSILVVLLAILLPSLARAREQSKNIICKSGMRQIGQLIFAFAAGHEGRGKAGSSRLADGAGRSRREGFEGGIVETDENPAVVDCQRGRRGTRSPDRRLRGSGNRDVLGIRQAVADEGGLERDERPPGAECRPDLGAQEESLAKVESSRVVHRDHRSGPRVCATRPTRDWSTAQRSDPVQLEQAPLYIRVKSA